LVCFVHLFVVEAWRLEDPVADVRYVKCVGKVMERSEIIGLANPVRESPEFGFVKAVVLQQV